MFSITLYSDEQLTEALCVAVQGLSGETEKVSSTRPETPSTLTEVDMEVNLDTYQMTLEEVLTWLLSAEDTLHMQDDVSSDVEEVKDQFHTHEVYVTHNNTSETLLIS